jgi:drug/metabolite transporter (DMT)-like permease
VIKPHAPPGIIAANGACFLAMIMWAVGFPVAEILLESWGAIALLSIRMFLATAVLVVLWIAAEGMNTVRNAAWVRGGVVGGMGFGFGAVLLLMGQKMSDAVTPAVAIAMMPIAGAAIEVALDDRRLRLHLVAGIVLALVGGLIATGVKLSDGDYGLGVLLCLGAVCLFAWATRATTRDFPTLSSLGQTTITLSGALAFTVLAYGVCMALGLGETGIGPLDLRHVTMLFIFAVPAVAIAQLLWIWGAGGLGILLASLHMNAVPFYVMVIVVLLLDAPWGWDQAAGAALVATGVLVAQLGGRRR